MFRFISYIQYLTKAVNVYSVHSPYLYSMIRFLNKKSFKDRFLYIFRSQNLVKDLEKFELSSTLISIDDLDYNLNIINQNYDKNFLIVENPHKDFLSEIKWNRILKSGLIRLSVDFYNVGIISFSKSFSKEHFIIKL